MDRNNVLIIILLLSFVWWMMKKRESFSEGEIGPALLSEVNDIPVTDEASRDEETKYLESRKLANEAFADGTALLPDEKSPFASDLTKTNFLTAGQQIGIDTRPQTKVKQLDIRSVPQVPRSSTDNPWFNVSPFDADLPKKRLD
jgi:hypothetical protein